MRIPKFLGRVLPADPTSDVALDRFERARKFEVERSAAAPSSPEAVEFRPQPRVPFDGLDELLELDGFGARPAPHDGQAVTVVVVSLPSRLPAPLSIAEARKAKRSWLNRLSVAA